MCLEGQISEKMNSELYAFSDTVLCLGGKCAEHPGATTAIPVKMITDVSRYLVPRHILQVRKNYRNIFCRTY